MSFALTSVIGPLRIGRIGNANLGSNPLSVDDAGESLHCWIVATTFAPNWRPLACLYCRHQCSVSYSSRLRIRSVAFVRVAFASYSSARAISFRSISSSSAVAASSRHVFAR